MSDAEIQQEGHKSNYNQLASQTTLEDILNIALSFERTARDFYRDLAPRVSKRIRDLVEELAEEEQRHYDLFEDLMKLPTIEAHIKDKIATPASDRRFSDHIQIPDLGDNPDDQEVLQFALGREQAAMEQYTSLAESAPEGPARDLFRFLAREETLHKQELEALYYEIVHSGGV